MNKNGLIGVGLVIVLWSIISFFQVIDSFFLPNPLEVFTTLFMLLSTGALNSDIIMTLFRIITSFGIATIFGIPIGLILGSSKKAYDSVEVLLDFVRSTPASAVFPLFLLVFGVNDESKIAVAVFCIIVVIIFNTAYGVRNSKKARVEAAKLMGATKKQIFTQILFWESLPQTLVGLRTSISLSLILIILTEMFIGTEFGIGRRIIDYQYTYSVAQLYATIILAGTIGYLLNQIFAQIETKIVHWSGK